MLQSVLTINKEEQLVFQDRSAHVSTILAALEGGTRRKCSGLTAVAEKAKTLSVKIVRAGLRGHVHRAGRGEVIRKIQAGLCELKFGDRAGRNACGGRRIVFIAHVHSIHCDSRAAAEAAPERNRRKSGLGRIEVAAVLNLDARLELCEIEEVASIHRQIFNLLGGQASRHLSLIRIDGHSLAAYFHNRAGSAELELDRRAGNLVDLHNVGSSYSLKAWCLYSHRVRSRNQRTRCERSGRR